MFVSSRIKKPFLTIMISGAALANLSGASEPVDYVNPYMGNISHVLKPTYPTVQLPFSMMRVLPRRADFSDMEVEGLPVMVYSHRNVGTNGLELFVSDSEDGPELLYPRKYSYDREKITPYSFSIFLEGEEIAARYAPSFKSAIYEIDFSASKNEKRNFKLWSANGRAQAGTDTISFTENLPKKAKMHIVMRFDKTPEKTYVSADGKFAVAVFPPSEKTIRAKYGVSFISKEQAGKNLDQEIADFDIASVEKKGRKLWNEKLSKIKVAGSQNEMEIFYTSLWRTYERMADFSEYGKCYNPFDGKVHEVNGPFYYDDWIWDTYRTSHPLRILIEPETEAAMLNSYIAMAEASHEKWLPTFPQIFGDAHSMNGNHAVISFLDAYVKGLSGVDFKRAFELSKNTLETATIIPWFRAYAGELDDFYSTYGFFPALREGERESVEGVSKFEKRQSVAVTLGASYDDWCLAQMAKAWDDKDTFEKFQKRSRNYLNIWNEKTKFFHPKDKSEHFIEPFDYRFSGGIGFRDYYDENNAYSYRWDLAFNIAELVELMGGGENFAKILDELFVTPLGKEKRDFHAQTAPDQTGNIGQFAMGNEPCFHIPFLYNHAGMPWKTQKMARTVLDMWFRNDLMGIPGDEDGGAMSAFVVFTQLGLYPTSPGKAFYDIASPYFWEAEIDLGAGKSLKILAPNASRQNKYVKSLKFNGRPVNSAQIPHSLIKDGGVLEFEMSDKPNRQWGLERAKF